MENESKKQQNASSKLHKIFFSTSKKRTIAAGLAILIFAASGYAVYRFSGWFHQTESEKFLTSQKQKGNEALKKAEDGQSVAQKLHYYDEAAKALNKTGRQDELVPLLEELRDETPKSNEYYPFVLEALARSYVAANQYEKAIQTQQNLIRLYGSYESMPYSKFDARRKLNFYKEQTKADDFSIFDPSETPKQ